MITIPSPQQGDPDKELTLSEGIQESTLPDQHEINITDGGEFLDDGIRMKDQPFGEEAMEKMNKSLKISGIKKISKSKNENFMLTTEQPQKAKLQSDSKGAKNIVLVHGAFADGSSWAKVIPLLQAKGYNVIAVQNPLTSLADDVAATKRAIALMDGPVLLAAHSYGGMVITEAGNDPKVVGLLYVAALVPEAGQNANDVNAAMPTTGIEKEFHVSPEGFVSLSMKAVNENFVPDAPPAERSLIYATQVPLAAGAGEEKVNSPAWKNKPSWFIVAAQDKVINPDLERFKAKLIKAKTIELTSGHVPMVTHPTRVADFIIRAAQAL